jgi:hypothetical protein
MANVPIINFNSGELTPLVDARSDIQKYSAGCRICENMIPRIYGNAERRPGLEFIAEAYDSSTVNRLIPFIYSNTIAYVIEMADLIFRFFYDGAIVLDDDDNEVTTVSPYPAADLFQVQYCQSNDIMFLTHQRYAIRMLSRQTASEFLLEEVEFNYGPFLDRNDLINDDDITLACSVIAANATGTLTAAGPMSPVEVFESGHVGALFMLTLPRVTVGTSGTATGTGTIGSAIDVDGPFTFTTDGHWGATVQLQRNENSNGWEVYRTWKSTISGGVGSLNVQYTGIEYAQNVRYRIYVSAYTGGTVQASLSVNTSTQSGIVKIQSVTNSYTATCKVISKLASTDATKQWYEGAWSDVRGYPKTMTFYEDRAWYAGSSYQPQTLWASETGAYNIVR